MGTMHIRQRILELLRNGPSTMTMKEAADQAREEQKEDQKSIKKEPSREVE